MHLRQHYLKDSERRGMIGRDISLRVMYISNDYFYTPSPPENWPLTDKSARDELEELRSTHCVVLIPAYNIQGNLIKPAAYRRCLENALVELHFNLTHWSIAGKKGLPGNDVFTADIPLIRVIAPPCSSAVVTPKRRQISLFIDLLPRKFVMTSFNTR